MPGHALHLISAICSVFILNSFSDYFPGWRIVCCMFTCAWRSECQQVESDHRHSGPCVRGAHNWRDQSARILHGCVCTCIQIDSKHQAGQARSESTVLYTLLGCFHWCNLPKKQQLPAVPSYYYNYMSAGNRKTLGQCECLVKGVLCSQASRAEELHGLNSASHSSQGTWSVSHRPGWWKLSRKPLILPLLHVNSLQRNISGLFFPDLNVFIIVGSLVNLPPDGHKNIWMDTLGQTKGLSSVVTWFQ